MANAVQQDFKSAKGSSGNKYAKGSNSYFRITYNTHLSLSQMTDHKAHLMLIMSTGMLTWVMFKQHSSKLMKLPPFSLPTIMLVVVCLTVAVLAILAARPVLPPRQMNPSKVNWLFFGSFAAFSFQEYHANLHALMQDDQGLRDAMSRDIHLLGKSLARKYHYLSYCYRVFMFGMPATVLAHVLYLLAVPR